jgi:1-acyl-sn-glycerol-3-phosphate acyltransferase
MTRDAFDFKPPLESPWVIALARLLSPVALRVRKITGVEVSPEDRERLRRLSGQRVVLTPNHPTVDEPIVVFGLSALLRRHFSFMVSRHIFDLLGGWVGWLLQRGGCYSVLRASADRDAVRTTRRLLTAGRRWLVLFPEGETGGHNDLVLPFHSGVTQMGFWAVDDMARAGVRAPLYVVPVAIKYLYTGDVRPPLYRSLWRLERELGLSPGQASPYERLRRIGDSVLCVLERAYQFAAPKGAGMSARIEALKEHVLSKVAAALGVRVPAGEPFPDRLRAVFNALQQVLYAEVSGLSAYEGRLLGQRQAEAWALREDLLRLRNFMAISDSYVEEAASAERFLEVASLLEAEVLGRWRTHGWRKAVLRVGEPVDLSALRAQYKRNKRDTVAAVTRGLESQTRSLLEDLGALAPVLPELRKRSSAAAGPTCPTREGDHC